MVAAPIYLVLKQWGRFAAWTAVFLGLSAVLKITWYDRLGRDAGYLPRDR
jgi:hypothetical protein